MKSWLSFTFAITLEVSIGIFMLFVCATNLICCLSYFGWPGYSKPHICSQALSTDEPKTPTLEATTGSTFGLAWLQADAVDFSAWALMLPPAQEAAVSPCPPALHLQIPPIPHATCVHHDATKVHCGKSHVLPVTGFGYFKLALISETSPIRAAWPCNSGGCSSLQHNPQAGQRLRHQTTSPKASAPDDKHRAHQQYGKCCWIQLLHHLYKTNCFKAYTRQSHILSQSSSRLGERTTLGEFFSWTQ